MIRISRWRSSSVSRGRRSARKSQSPGERMIMIKSRRWIMPLARKIVCRWLGDGNCTRRKRKDAHAEASFHFYVAGDSASARDVKQERRLRRPIARPCNENRVCGAHMDHNEIRDLSQRNLWRARGRPLLIETFKSPSESRERAFVNFAGGLFMQSFRSGEWETDYCHYVARRLKIYLAFPRESRSGHGK